MCFVQQECFAEKLILEKLNLVNSGGDLWQTCFYMGRNQANSRLKNGVTLNEKHVEN